MTDDGLGVGEGLNLLGSGVDTEEGKIVAAGLLESVGPLEAVGALVAELRIKTNNNVSTIFIAVVYRSIDRSEAPQPLLAYCL